MLIAIKIVVLLITLGLDNLVMSTSLGMINPKGKVRIAAAFAAAEAIMPLVGLMIGTIIGGYMGSWATIVGGVLLFVVGVWLFFFDEDDDEDDHLKQRFIGWSLLVTAISISLDELAVGFSIGLIGVPIILTMILIAISATLFTTIGVTFGSMMKRYLGEWTEKLGGLIIILLGLWMILDHFL